MRTFKLLGTRGHLIPRGFPKEGGPGGSFVRIFARVSMRCDFIGEGLGSTCRVSPFVAVRLVEDGPDDRGGG